MISALGADGRRQDRLPHLDKAQAKGLFHIESKSSRAAMAGLKKTQSKALRYMEL